MGVQINIKKADKDYSVEIKNICERLNIIGDFTIEIYIDKNVEDIFEKLYGYRIPITGGVYEEIKRRIFVNLDDISVRRTLEHEFSHVKFNELYSENNDKVLDFIDEYIANIAENEVSIIVLEKSNLLNIELPENYKEDLIKMFERAMDNIDKLITDNVVSIEEDSEQTYMRRIAKLLAYKNILKRLDAYKSKDNMQYQLIRGLYIWEDVLDDVNYYNVNEKYEKARKAYIEYASEYLGHNTEQ